MICPDTESWQLFRILKIQFDLKIASEHLQVYFNWMICLLSQSYVF